MLQFDKTFTLLLENTGDLYNLESVIIEKRRVFKSNKIAEFKEAVDIITIPEKSLIFLSNKKGKVQVLYFSLKLESENMF